MTEPYRLSACRVCGGNLDTILDLGYLHPSTFLRPEETPAPPVPHDLCACADCQLVQLRHTLEPDAMFRNYWYLSGVNEVMREELADIAQQAQSRVLLRPGDAVVDVGANDGTLLSAYPTTLLRVAFEPALNLQQVLHGQADLVVADYFPQGLHELGLKGQVKILTSIACFYAVDDPRAFVKAVAEVLHPDGIWIVQFQDWDQMQKATAFDNIVTEHLFYPSLAAIERMLIPFNLRVLDAERRAINGGSYRLYIGRPTAVPEHPHVEALRHCETGCEDWGTFDRFAWRCEEARKQIQGMLAATRGTIDVYGASTKFSTLAQWCGITGTTIRQAWERSPAKFGLRTPSGIPIVNEVEGRMDPPDALLIGIWQHRESVLRREASYLDEGGRIIFPLPRVDLVQGTQHGA